MPPPALAADPSPATARRHVEFQRLTDEVGINQSPAISPDGKMVAFVAAVNGRRQVWIRLLTGGAPLQVTRDEVDHLYPRWAPDSSALIYFTPPESSGGEGALWEVSALGGLPRPIIGALGGGDISHDGRRIALLRADEGRVVLTTVARDGSDPQPVAKCLAATSGDLPAGLLMTRGSRFRVEGPQSGTRCCGSFLPAAASAGR